MTASGKFAGISYPSHASSVARTMQLQINMEEQGTASRMQPNVDVIKLYLLRTRIGKEQTSQCVK